MNNNLKRIVRIFVTLLALLTLGALYYGFTQLRVYDNQWVSLFNRVLVFFFALYIAFIANTIFFERNRPSKTISWLMVLYIQPIVGFILYILFGQNVQKKWKARKKQRNHKHKIQQAADIQKEILDYIELFSNEESLVNDRLINLLLRSSDAPFFINNEVDVLTDGQETFDQMIDKMEKHGIIFIYNLL